MEPTLYSRAVLIGALVRRVVEEAEEVAVVPIPGEAVGKGMVHPPRAVVVIVVLVVVVFVPLILILRRISELVGRAFLVSGTLVLISMSLLTRKEFFVLSHRGVCLLVRRGEESAVWESPHY